MSRCTIARTGHALTSLATAMLCAGHNVDNGVESCTNVQLKIECVGDALRTCACCRRGHPSHFSCYANPTCGTCDLWPDTQCNELQPYGKPTLPSQERIHVMAYNLQPQSPDATQVTSSLHSECMHACAARRNVHGCTAIETTHQVLFVSEGNTSISISNDLTVAQVLCNRVGSAASHGKTFGHPVWGRAHARLPITVMQFTRVASDVTDAGPDVLECCTCMPLHGNDRRFDLSGPTSVKRRRTWARSQHQDTRRSARRPAVGRAR
jgi:hypothetical protein